MLPFMRPADTAADSPRIEMRVGKRIEIFVITHQFTLHIVMQTDHTAFCL